MSKNQAVAFLAKVAEDPALQEKVGALREGDGAGLLALAAATGFEVSPADLREAIAGGDELGEADLDRVAGGTQPMFKHVAQALSSAARAL